jgi:hypothetical protein
MGSLDIAFGPSITQDHGVSILTSASGAGFFGSIYRLVRKFDNRFSGSGLLKAPEACAALWLLLGVIEGLE